MVNEPKAARVAAEKVRDIVSREGRIDYEKLKESMQTSVRDASEDTTLREQNLISCPAIRKIAKEKRSASEK